MNDPIETWHEYVRSRNPALLDGLLADDVVFESPVVFTPQRGKAITTKYLHAAVSLLGAESFAYVGTWTAPLSAVLEFTAVVDGITLNGVDLITWNAAGKITHFKVMVRPLQGLNTLHRKMGELLAASIAS
jgi:hypothetical protein